MRSLLKKIAILALLTAPGAAFAEPWCLVSDAKENCKFLTADECYQQSNRRGGYCKPNPREVGVLGYAPYCVITGDSKRCSYRSRAQCLLQARQSNGGCVRNTELDLARRAAGQARAVGCSPTDVTCALTQDEFTGGLEAAGYSTEQVGVDSGGGDF